MLPITLIGIGQLNRRHEGTTKSSIGRNRTPHKRCLFCICDRLTEPDSVDGRARLSFRQTGRRVVRERSTAYLGVFP